MKNNSPIIGFRYPRKEELERKAKKQGFKLSVFIKKILDKFLSSQES